MLAFGREHRHPVYGRNVIFNARNGQCGQIHRSSRHATSTNPECTGWVNFSTPVRRVLMRKMVPGVSLTDFGSLRGIIS